MQILNSAYGATIFGAGTNGPAQGATIFSGIAPNTVQTAAAILDLLLPGSTVAQAAAAVLGMVTPADAAPPGHWRGECDDHWPYSAHEQLFDQDGEVLQAASCTCSDAIHRDVWPLTLQQYIGGHAHTYRVVCPKCLWYANVADDQLYPVPVHGGANNRCSGAYTLVRSELYAYPRGTWPQYDSAPASWQVYNKWTGKYVTDRQGGEDPDVDQACKFSTWADAVQFVQSSQGTAIAKAFMQPLPEDATAHCNWCQKSYPISTIECVSCLATVDPVHNPIEDLIRSYFDRGMCSWVYVWPLNKNGKLVSGGGPL
jgi:hypothetical protein